MKSYISLWAVQAAVKHAAARAKLHRLYLAHLGNINAVCDAACHGIDMGMYKANAIGVSK